MDAYALYRERCRRDGVRHDPYVLDVLLSLVDFMQGGAAQPWWAFTVERKARWPEL